MKDNKVEQYPFIHSYPSTEKSFCPICGEKNIGYQKFCPRCGAQVAAEKSQEDTPMCCVYAAPNFINKTAPIKTNIFSKIFKRKK